MSRTARVIPLLASAPAAPAASPEAYSWLGSGSPTEWLVFTVVVGAMLVIDLVVSNRKDEVVKASSALFQTFVWIAIAMLFAVYVFWVHGRDPSLLFVTGFVIEKALSVDNLFVFLVVFSYFKVKPSHQRRVLFWGILTAVFLRAALIFAGAAIVARFHWVLYLFGVFLLWTAYKLLTTGEGDEVDPSENRWLKLLRKYVPMQAELDGNHFFSKKSGKLMATPLLAVLVVIETTDVVFALDSVPAIFAITQDPYLIYTSNIFAILGLRALYFALASMMGKFRYLNVGLALVLAFVGLKMLTEEWVHVPIPVSLGVVFVLIAGSIIASVINPGAPDEPHGPEITENPVHDGKTEPVKPATARPEESAT